MELHLWTAEEDLDAVFSLYHRRVGRWGGSSVPLEPAVRANNRMDMLCDCGIRVESGCMIVTPVDHGLDLLASDLVRSSGTHASDIYGSFYEEAEPSRYRRDTPPEPLLLALGTAWEKHLEYLLIKNGIRAERPEEQMDGQGHRDGLGCDLAAFPLGDRLAIRAFAVRIVHVILADIVNTGRRTAFH